jgi:hypothetical protein
MLSRGPSVRGKDHTALGDQCLLLLVSGMTPDLALKTGRSCFVPETSARHEDQGSITHLSRNVLTLLSDLVDHERTEAHKKRRTRERQSRRKGCPEGSNQDAGDQIPRAVD